MKILQVLVKDTVGGAEVLALGLAGEYKNFSHGSHLVVLGQPGPLNTKFESAFESVTYLGLEFSPRTWIRSIRRYKRVIAGLNPDVIHSHLFIANFYSLLFSPRKIRHVVTLHSSGLESESAFTKLIALMIRPLLKPEIAVTACSDSARELGIRLGYGNDIQVIPNGIEVPDSLPKPTLTSKAFISLARLHPMKDHTTLFAAFKIFAASHPDWRLDRAGTGVSLDNPEIKSLVSELKLEALIQSGQIRLLGPIDNPVNILPDYSAMVLSSQSGEALPMAGIEALSVGLPVIATDVGDLKDLVIEKELLVKPKDKAALAGAMDLFALSTESQWMELSQKCMELAVASFSISSGAERYLDSVYLDKS